MCIFIYQSNPGFLYRFKSIIIRYKIEPYVISGNKIFKRGQKKTRAARARVCVSDIGGNQWFVTRNLNRGYTKRLGLGHGQNPHARTARAASFRGDDASFECVGPFMDFGCRFSFSVAESVQRNATQRNATNARRRPTVGASVVELARGVGGARARGGGLLHF